jgi:hypothetical protein
MEQFKDVKISFDSDRDYTNLDSMIKYSKNLEEKLKACEAERDKLKGEVKWFNQILSGNSKGLSKKFQALEKIAREGLERIRNYNLHDDEGFRILEWLRVDAKDYLKKIDELIKGDK